MLWGWGCRRLSAPGGWERTEPKSHKKLNSSFRKAPGAARPTKCLVPRESNKLAEKEHQEGEGRPEPGLCGEHGAFGQAGQEVTIQECCPDAGCPLTCHLSRASCVLCKLGSAPRPLPAWVGLQIEFGSLGSSGCILGGAEKNEGGEKEERKKTSSHAVLLVNVGGKEKAG